ncbi:transposase [Adlercreutzia faecimuris]|uniref:Transposase n=1 Tax=Adlercreutzia faecimuris TaxID=2897341 RepID=A0ABS9WIS5_9ACTN|nr:transposase [Adlercreutzia sp. JBNU-10]MCI2242675.1 transposase [Adlercreutzia sp. JBNU-10]
MVRTSRSRRESEAGIYHVVSRGVGRQLIFEDDGDRQCYLDLLQREVEGHGGSVLAWCLMGNHTHLLLKMGLADLSESMRLVNSAYALRFNKRHGRVGHLMQGRFKSEPVDTDEYLLTVIRYIHQNPEKAGIGAAASYPWSSYREYAGEPAVADTSLVLEMLGGVSGFKRFHEASDASAPCVDENRGRRVLDDDSALEAARLLLAPTRVEEVAALPRERRDEALCRLKAAGLSVRQVERLTGVSKSVVAKARAKAGQ